MKNYKLHTPEGVKDYLGKSALLKNRIETDLMELFLSYGYERIETPSFEYLDVFTSAPGDYHNKTLYKWMNRQGEMVALRSDMTKSIARIVASQNKQLLPARYTYLANSFRYPERYQGKNHEFTQAGVELIGTNAIESDVEILRIVIEGLTQIGVNDFKIHMGNAILLESLVEECGVSKEIEQAIYQAIQHKDAVQLKATVKQLSDKPEYVGEILENMGGIGGIELIEGLKKVLKTSKALHALEQLEESYHLLCEYQENPAIIFDLNIFSYASYYTGLMFQVFIPGIGEAVVEGGRYDRLMGEFGKNLPAVGFGMNIYLLLQKIEENPLDAVDLIRDTVLLISPKEQKRLSGILARQLRQKNYIVTDGLGMTLEEAFNYSKARGIKNIYFITLDDFIECYDLKQNHMERVALKELIVQ